MRNNEINYSCYARSTFRNKENYKIGVVLELLGYAMGTKKPSNLRDVT